MTTYEYEQPAADQAERRAIIRARDDAKPTSYHALAQHPADSVPSVTGASAKP